LCRNSIQPAQIVMDSGFDFASLRLVSFFFG
jgi:hypothetical protein